MKDSNATHSKCFSNARNSPSQAIATLDASADGTCPCIFTHAMQNKLQLISHILSFLNSTLPPSYMHRCTPQALEALFWHVSLVRLACYLLFFS